MGDWTAGLKGNPMEWLLSSENPSVRYFALRDLLGLPETDVDVQATRGAIMQGGVVPQMLARMDTEEYRKGLPGLYTNKYAGLVWSLIVLAELGASPNAQIADLCEYLLSHAQERTEGGFAQHEAVKTGGGRQTEVIPCLSGNMVWSLIRLGCLDDPRVQQGIDWLTTYQRLNDGIETNPQVERYGHYDMCWGAHTCHMGVVKALKAYAAIPPEKRGAKVEAAIAEAAEFMLIHHIFKQSHNLKRISKPGWRRFGFPLMYQTDALEILDILTGLGYRDPRMAEAVELVLGKQDAQGCWALENTYANTRLLVPFGVEGEPDKWITLRAMRVYKRYTQG